MRIVFDTEDYKISRIKNNIHNLIVSLLLLIKWKLGKYQFKEKNEK